MKCRVATHLPAVAALAIPAGAGEAPQLLDVYPETVEERLLVDETSAHGCSSRHGIAVVGKAAMVEHFEQVSGADLQSASEVRIRLFDDIELLMKAIDSRSGTSDGVLVRIVSYYEVGRTESTDDMSDSSYRGALTFWDEEIAYGGFSSAELTFRIDRTADPALVSVHEYDKQRCSLSM